MSTPAEYYERHWSEDGHRSLSSLHKVLQHQFEAHASPSARCPALACRDRLAAGLWTSGRTVAYGASATGRRPVRTVSS